MIKKWPNLSPFLVAAVVSIAIATAAYLIFPYCDNTAYQTGDPTVNCHQAGNKVMTLLNFLESHNTAINVITSIFTLILTSALVLATIRIYKHTAASERAYVKMSHTSPGLDFESKRPAILLNIEVKNSGRTPARLLDTVFKVEARTPDSLPDKPDYSGSKKEWLATAFLVTEDCYYHHLKTSALPTTQLREVRTGNLKLYVYGYVDYVDTFGQRHRSKYGRVYDPKRDIRQNYRTDKDYDERNNLIYFALPQYNDDHPI